MIRPKTTTYMYPVVPPFDIAYRNGIVSHPAGPHTHNAAEIYFTLTDLPDVLLNDTVSAVPAGTILIIPAFCLHQLYHEAGVSYERYVLCINSEWIKAVLCENTEDYPYLFDSAEPVLLSPESKQKRELLRLFNGLLSFTGKATPESMLSFFSVFQSLHIAALKNGSVSTGKLPVSPAQQRVNQMIAYLHEHIRENTTLSDLSEHFYLNPDYLARLFKNHMHISVGHYIILQKVSVAETLLREGKSVTEVQELLGFSDYAHFFKTFQKTTGISPSRYRKQYL